MEGKEEKEMKIKEKLSGYKKQISVCLAAVILLTAGIGYYHMKNAKGYVEEYVGYSKHYSDGKAVIMVDGPDGTSKMNIRFRSNDYSSNPNQAGYDFIKNPHSYTVYMSTTEADSLGGGPYNLRIDTQNITSEWNGSDGYTVLKFKIKMKIPAHQEHRYGDQVTADTVNDVECGSYGDGGFWSQSGHRSYDDNDVEVECRMSVMNTGLTTLYNNGSFYRYSWPSMTMHLVRLDRNVTYDGNGGKLDYSQKTFHDGQYMTFPSAQREGYTLDGWLDDGTKYNSDEGWQVCEKDYKETAQWTANTYTVSYDGNGEDSGAVSEETATYDSNYTFAANGYKKKGYSFVGWSTNKNASTAEYSSGQTITWKNTGDMTLYAVWTKSSYEVSFDGNGASGSKKTADLKYGQDDKLPANTFQRSGYTFMGWSEDPDVVKPKYTDGQTVNTLCDAGKTYELYAVWKKTDGSFDTHNIIHDDGMFNGSIELEGQNGTGFTRDHIDSKYARIDENGQPGYFTNRYK